MRLAINKKFEDTLDLFDLKHLQLAEIISTDNSTAMKIGDIVMRFKDDLIDFTLDDYYDNGFKTWIKTDLSKNVHRIKILKKGVTLTLE